MALQLPTMPNFNTTIPQQIAAMPSPLEQYGKMLQLKQLSGQINQQQQMQPLQLQQAQQQLQASTLENEQRTLEMNSQKAMQKAWSDPDFLKTITGSDAAQSSGVGFDPGALTSTLIKNGVLPKDALSMTQGMIDRSQKIATTLKDQAQTGEANATIRDKGMKVLADKIGSVLDQPAEKAGEALASLKQDIVNNPQAYAGIPKDDLAHVYGADLEHLPAMAGLIGLDSKIAEFHKSKFEAGSAALTEEQKAAEVGYQSTIQKLLNGQKPSADELASAHAYEASQRKSTTQSDTLGVTSHSTSGPSGLSSINHAAARATAPASTAAVAAGDIPKAAAAATAAGTPVSPQNLKTSIVDEIGQYKVNPQLFTRLLTKHPELIAEVGQKYPDWDQTSYNAKNAIVTKYTSGGESKSINAISTALGHAGELGDAIDALNNSNGLNVLRNISNKLGIQAGSDKVTTFNLVVHRLAPEIAAAYIQGGGGEGERAGNADDFSAALGDKQLRSNLGETVKLLRSKIAAQEQQWNTTYKPTRPEDDFSTRFLTPGAKQTLSKWSPQQPSGGGAQQTGGLPPGATHIVLGPDKRRHYTNAAGTVDFGIAPDK